MDTVNERIWPPAIDVETEFPYLCGEEPCRTEGLNVQAKTGRCPMLTIPEIVWHRREHERVYAEQAEQARLEASAAAAAERARLRAETDALRPEPQTTEEVEAERLYQEQCDETERLILQEEAAVQQARLDEIQRRQDMPRPEAWEWMTYGVVLRPESDTVSER